VTATNTAPKPPLVCRRRRSRPDLATLMAYEEEI
jgi:hypothetical protein